MSGVIAIRTLLVGSAALIAQCPAAKIMAGTIPQGTVMPAIAVNEISVVERNTVTMTETRPFTTARVQVTVMASTYVLQKSLLELVRKACRNTRGSVGGVDVDSILPDGAGPDLFDAEEKLYMQSRDFFVRFSPAA